MPRPVRRVAVAVAGSVLVALGLVLVVTPGPACVVLPAGLAVLGVEFETPRRMREGLLAWGRARLRREDPGDA